MTRTFRLHHGDCLEVLKAMPDASVDACVTDPPYDLTNRTPDVFGCAECGRTLGGRDGRPETCPRCGGALTRQRSAQGKGFMGKAWDGTGIAFNPELWSEVYRTLKDGSRLLAFGGTRTYHRLTAGIEDAGFTIEDCIMWIYGQGFPKHKSKLKPAYEPIVVARKGGASHLNIDACRIGIGPTDDIYAKNPHTVNQASNQIYGAFKAGSEYTVPEGRWPANVVLDEISAATLDLMSGERGGGFATRGASTKIYGGGKGFTKATGEEVGYGDAGGASRFFYCAKADTSERGAGNTHPTVKPLSLMCWLVRLITPEGGTILDPFTGSGSTGIAALREGFNFVGIERESEYVEIARRRIAGDAPLLNTEAA